MTDISFWGAGASAVALGAAGWFAKSFAIWVRSRDSRHQVDRTVDAQLEEHRDKLTFELLTAAREEMKQLREEATKLRPLMVHAAHLEEALDHLHALLHSNTTEEMEAARRRANAFLRRMRGDDRKGALRNEVQTEISAKRLKDDLRQQD